MAMSLAQLAPVWWFLIGLLVVAWFVLRQARGTRPILMTGQMVGAYRVATVGCFLAGRLSEQGHSMVTTVRREMRKRNVLFAAVDPI